MKDMPLLSDRLTKAIAVPESSLVCFPAKLHSARAVDAVRRLRSVAPLQLPGCGVATLEAGSGFPGMMRRGIRLGLLAFIVLGGGCRPEPKIGVTIELWGLGREGEVARELMPEFERRHPEIRVNVQQIPWSAAHEKLLTAYVGEAMPDVFQIGNTWVPELVALGAVAPLDVRVDGSQTVELDDYFPGFVDASRIDDHLYGLPWYVDTRLLFYRSDRLREAGIESPPGTWAEWVAAMKRLREQGRAGESAVLLPLTEWHPLVILALQRGARLLRDDDTRGDFQSEAFRAAFSFYVDLFREGLAPLSAQTQLANLYQDFARGAFAFYVSGPWNLGEFSRRLPEGVEWATAPCPAAAGTPPGVSTAGGSSLALSTRALGSPRAEAGWRLIEFLSEPAQQRELYRLTGDLPSRRSAWEEGGPGSDPRARAFRAQLEHVRTTPKIPEWERVAAQILRHAELTVRGRLEIDEALAALDHEVDDLLEKRRWMLARGADG